MSGARRKVAEKTHEKPTTAVPKDYIPRLKALYKAVAVEEIKKRFNLSNPWQAPRLQKIVINMGVGQGKEDVKYFDQIKEDLAQLAGQAPAVRRAKKSIAGFKIRQGQPIGLTVTLRGSRMWEFLDRMTTIALARIRDFRGLDPRAFDKQANYNLGIREHHIFPEVNLERSPRAHGMNITIVTSSKDWAQVQATLELLGLPFRKAGKK
ncbi:MAG: 50S ribosomal protein L5 [Elusimicrobia bacterium]|nr:50S ribosomal protein L5 [Elusimicrobiota bacterium]